MVCGGAGWVHEHELGCPLEELMDAMGVEPTKGNCRYCDASFEIVYYQAPIVSGECTRCFMDRSRGRAYVERQARATARQAKAYKATGDIRSAKKAAKNARRLLAMLKVNQRG